MSGDEENIGTLIIKLKEGNDAKTRERLKQLIEQEYSENKK